MIFYPSDVTEETARAVAADYAVFFDVVRDVLPESGYTEIQSYIVPVDSMPEAYRFHVERHGEQWRNIHVSPLMLVGGKQGGAGYWTQLGKDAHEMAHGYVDVMLMECAGDNTALRWLEDGIAEVVRGEFMRASETGAFDEWRETKRIGRELVPDEEPGNLLNWPVGDPARMTREELERNVTRFALAESVVRSIYHLDGGARLRALVDAVQTRPPRSPQAMRGVLEAVLSPDELQQVGF